MIPIRGLRIRGKPSSRKSGGGRGSGGLSREGEKGPSACLVPDRGVRRPEGSAEQRGGGRAKEDKADEGRQFSYSILRKCVIELNVFLLFFCFFVSFKPI